MRANFFLLVVVLTNLIGYSQTLSGTVLDSKTKTPIETATVYFDNTTLGVITNSDGKFSIKYLML